MDEKMKLQKDRYPQIINSLFVNPFKEPKKEKKKKKKN